MKRFVLSLIIVCCFVALTDAQTSKKHSNSSKQPEFVQLPKELLQQLARDDRDVANFLRQGFGNDPIYAFTAMPVDLNVDGKADYIVYPPTSMDGNSSGPRWI